MHISNFRNFKKEIEILIISRYIHYFLECEITAKKTFIWIHDVCLHSAWNHQYLPGKGEFLIKNLIDRIDGFIYLTEWHKNNFIKQYSMQKYQNKILRIVL